MSIFTTRYYEAEIAEVGYPSFWLDHSRSEDKRTRASLYLIQTLDCLHPTLRLPLLSWFCVFGSGTWWWGHPRSSYDIQLLECHHTRRATPVAGGYPKADTFRDGLLGPTWQAITERTKVIISELAGCVRLWPFVPSCGEKQDLFTTTSKSGRPLTVSWLFPDSAHAGIYLQGQPTGSIADFTSLLIPCR